MFSSFLHKATMSQVRSPVQPQHKLKLQCFPQTFSITTQRCSCLTQQISRNPSAASSASLYPQVVQHCTTPWPGVQYPGYSNYSYNTGAFNQNTVTSQHHSGFPEQYNCRLPQDPSCSRHSAQLGIPRVSWADRPMSPTRAWCRARHGAAAAAPQHSAH